MMSDSDDTDVLLLIPPDWFLVPSSDSEESEIGVKGRSTTVVSELVDHVQSLENRISAIESKDTSLNTSFLNNSIDAQFFGSATNTSKPGQLTSRPKFGSVSHISSLQTTPIKGRRACSVPSTPNNHQPSQTTANRTCHCAKSLPFADSSNTHSRTNASKSSCTNSLLRAARAELLSRSDTAITCSDKGTHGMSPLKETATHIEINRTAKNNEQRDRTVPQISFSLPSARANYDTPGKRSIKEMELAEVDELLHEMESTEFELRQCNRAACPSPTRAPENDTKSQEIDASTSRSRLEFESQSLVESRKAPSLWSSESKNSATLPRASLPFDEDSLHLDETDKMISDFKIWRQSCYHSSDLAERGNKMSNADDLKKYGRAHRNNPEHNGTDVDRKIMRLDLMNNGTVHSQQSSNRDEWDIAVHSAGDKFRPQTHLHSTQFDPPASQPITSSRMSLSANNFNNGAHESVFATNFNIPHKATDAATNTERSRKPQRLLTLSDFWENDPDKTEEDMLRIKLEEEKFRREHCEQVIQDLQKRLLEQQEKVAVAVRVDNEKNVVINRLQNAWTKLKIRWQALEAESKDLHLKLKKVQDERHVQQTELTGQIKRYEGELSKALDLAAGYKEKSDTMTAEKLDLLKNHADELENYKALVQEAEERYVRLKTEYSNLSDQNQQLGELLKNTQQEVNRERMRGGEVRGEMGVIHKALDACEAELVVLRQEKESLQLKLREEVNRNTMLEQNKKSYLAAIDEAKNAERLAREEAACLSTQQEKMRVELRQVYQKQVDDVVQAKLQEFQTQLDAAENVFQNELESRQRAVAECAARKIKSILDKHQLEINLLEEKHKEEKRLSEIQLAQAMQQVSMLDSKLNSQQADKTQLAEQLHSVMQKQWHQALKIISGGNMDNLTPIQRIHAEKLSDMKHPMKSESSPNIGNKVVEPTRLESQSMPMIDIGHFQSNHNPQERGPPNLNVPSQDTPLTSRRDQSKDDLRKYIKMILDMQQPKSNFTRVTCGELRESPTLTCREVPRKHYTKKEESFHSEESSVMWQPSSEVSVHEETEYISVPQKLPAKGDHPKSKPPWK